ncbi:class I SAM-dependent methyltransferase [Aliterella atlantica]|uniref:Methyltransferase domain-containing protein n=2 Tax=Aliterella TaxID=1827277 RepID=A0A0D8ZVT1_9CYAN|nr:class I SAM-dependent methyltransferase [Aliterella atlantica]KJH71326.1 hypothetical protein UH38_13680 [Aliterella atlantica CENA595]
MNEYVFASAEQQAEFARLKLLEDAFDAQTQQIIQSLGVAAGWKCLELGPGAGSILAWLSDLVGSSGQVVGVDKNTAFIESISAPQISKIAGDILDVELEDNSFDLIHARYVLVHIVESVKVIDKLIKLLKPGGLLVLEEPAFTAAQVIDNSLPNAQAHQRVNAAISQMFIDLNLEPAIGLKLPLLLQQNNLHIENVLDNRHLSCGNSKVAKVAGSSAATLQTKYVQTQKASVQDVEAYINNSFDSNFWAIYYSTISVVGKKIL